MSYKKKKLWFCLKWTISGYLGTHSSQFMAPVRVITSIGLHMWSAHHQSDQWPQFIFLYEGVHFTYPCLNHICHVLGRKIKGIAKADITPYLNECYCRDTHVWKIDIFQYVEKAKASNKHFEFILARRITTIEWWYIQERHTIPWYCQDFTSTNVPAVWSKRWKPGYLVQIKLHQQRWLNERIEITCKQSWHEQTRSVWYLSHNFKAKYRLSLYQFLLNMALYSKST